MNGILTRNINRKIIRHYTRESGVRNLEREISKIARKLVKKIDNNEKVNNPVNEKDLKDLLGVQKFNYGEIEEENRIGVVTGLSLDRSWRRNFKNRICSNAWKRKNANHWKTWRCNARVC